ncbi:porin [Sphingomonas oleivorans]|nr:porin [Sphingomonas oleivorans]
MGALAALSLLAFAPVTATTTKPIRKARPESQILPLAEFGAFTPSAADPRRASALSRGGLLSGTSGAFRFTPSGNLGSRRAVTVAVRARTNARAEAARTASITPGIMPSAYNLGVSVGWKRFALSGDIAKVDGGLFPENRESADIGLAYLGKKWSTRLEIGADRTTGDRPRLIGDDESYSLGLGGSYSLTRNIDVTGGVRYRLQRDRLEPVVDNRRDSQAVYIGTAFRF